MPRDFRRRCVGHRERSSLAENIVPQLAFGPARILLASSGIGDLGQRMCGAFPVTKDVFSLCNPRGCIRASIYGKVNGTNTIEGLRIRCIAYTKES